MTTVVGHPVSRHFLRRTARKSAARFQRAFVLTTGGAQFEVVRSRRGPYRFYVIRVSGDGTAYEKA